MSRLLVVVLAAVLVAVAGAQPTYTLGGLFPITGGISSGLQRAAAAYLATELVNEEMSTSTLLPGKNFSLNLVINDTAVDQSTASRRAYMLLSGTWIRGDDGGSRDLLDFSCQPEATAARAIALIGAASSAVSRAVALNSQMFAVPQVSYSSTAPDLSSAVYRTFCRVVASDAVQARVLAAVCQDIGWNRVALISTTDSYGTGLSENFIREARRIGIEIVAYIPFEPLDGEPSPVGTRGAGIRAALEGLRAAGARVIVGHFLARDAQHVLRVASSLGMAGPSSGYQWISTDGWTSTDVVTESGSITADDLPAIRSALAGSIGLKPGANQNTNFADLWDLHKDRLAALFNAPAGSFDVLNTFSPFAYDTVWVYAHAINNLIADGGDPEDGRALVEAIRNVQFAGATGNVSFTSSCDRLTGFTVTNAQFTSAELASGVNPTLAIVALWSDGDGVGVVSPVSGQEIQFSDGSNVVTPVAFRELVDVDASIKNTTLAVVLVFFLVTFAFHGLVHRYREHPIIKANSPPLCHVILIGTQFAYATILAFVFGTNSFELCHLPSYFIFLAFSMTFGTLAARTYRINRIFHSKRIQAVSIKNKQILFFILGLCIYDTLVTFIYYGAAPATVVREPDFRDDSRDVLLCEYDSIAALATFIAVPKIVITFYGAYLAWQTRDVSYNFNESRAIAVAIYTELLVLGGTLAIWGSLRAHITVAHYALAGGVSIAMLTLVLVVLVPRFFLILSARRKDRKQAKITGEAHGGDEFSTGKSANNLSQAGSVTFGETRSTGDLYTLCVNCGGTVRKGATTRPDADEDDDDDDMNDPRSAALEVSQTQTKGAPVIGRSSMKGSTLGNPMMRRHSSQNRRRGQDDVGVSQLESQSNDTDASTIASSVRGSGDVFLDPMSKVVDSNINNNSITNGGDTDSANEE